uniref:Uncharacterized protein n=1 Tax=Anopheles dirus TaxID=7168 RepID=A0A182N9V4_9DIPT
MAARPQSQSHLWRVNSSIFRSASVGPVGLGGVTFVAYCRSCPTCTGIMAAVLVGAVAVPGGEATGLVVVFIDCSVLLPELLYLVPLVMQT